MTKQALFGLFRNSNVLFSKLGLLVFNHACLLRPQKLVEKALKCKTKNFSILFFYMKNFLYIRI